MESKHKEVREAREILQNVSKETNQIAQIINNLCDERDKFKAMLKELRAQTDKEIRSVKEAIEKTRKNYQNIVKQMSKKAREEAQANFCQEKKTLKEELEQLRKAISEAQDDNAMTEAINVNLNKKVEEIYKQSMKWMKATQKYEEENKELVELNEALAATLDFIQDKHNKEMEKLKQLYLGTLRTNSNSKTGQTNLRL